MAASTKDLKQKIKEETVAPKNLKEIKKAVSGYAGQEVEEQVEEMLEDGTLFYATETQIGRTL